MMENDEKLTNVGFLFRPHLDTIRYIIVFMSNIKMITMFSNMDDEG